MKDDLVDALHQPEYTGENRCGACTAVNVVIAGVLGVLLSRKSRLLGALAVGISLVLIYLRGYLVPGTPMLTKRYLPANVLRLFDKEPEGPAVMGGLGAVGADAAGAGGTPATAAPATGNRASDASPAAVRDVPADDADAASADEGADRDAALDAAQSPEEYFLANDVVEPCEDVDDLCLTAAFEDAWAAEMDAIDPETIDATDAARAFGLDEMAAEMEADADAADGDAADSSTGDDADHLEEFSIERYDDARVLSHGHRTVGKWPSQAALVADVTAARVLDDRDPAWDDLPPDVKGQLLNGLRLFLDTCPTSGGRVVMGEETVESCCQSHRVVAVTCEDTGERLFEHPVDDVEA